MRPSGEMTKALSKSLKGDPATITAEPVSFGVGVRYRPSYSASYWWERFSRDEVRRDWEAVVPLGLNAFRIDLTWPDFQPDRLRVSSNAMRNLEATLRVAEDLGANLTVALFPAVIDGRRRLPSWALAMAPRPEVRDLF